MVRGKERKTKKQKNEYKHSNKTTAKNENEKHKMIEVMAIHWM